MFEDKESTNWWLLVQAEPVGYWTTTLFTSLSHRAEALAWGGKVINSAHMGAHGQHTQTDMGSGHFLTMGNLRASFIRGIQFIDDKFFTRILWFLVPNITNKNCYDENEGEVSADWGWFLYCAGSGGWLDCK
ncbi:hypothetical protein VitviT2T_004391 [Vitis vinifera]|uniref:Neprosin PEP catalytic domain-containing protein n=1 Tax=Vitis vinifera TaxID=29760 RepID=A0ABY9BPT7_VITVI|nr:hypothetical protein VitviT2T_004391 [Vitis vinifera]|eukprot:XP_010648792.1 PREDICTED: uncharacterized protein LOC104879040 [Vitis vinifera]